MPPPPWRDWAAAARLPNLPTVWSNTATAYLLILDFSRAALLGTKVRPDFSPTALTLLLAAATLLYLFGTFLNDAMDAEFDRRHRPDRAIPAGRIARDTMLHAALACGSLGITLTLFLGKFAPLAATILAAAILLYTWLHKKSPLGIPLMGLCRALLVPLAASAILSHWGNELRPTAWYATAAMLLLCSYTSGISLVARSEATGAPGRAACILARFLLALPFLLPTACVLVFWARDPELFSPDTRFLLHIALPGLIGLGWLCHATSGLRLSPATFVTRALPGLALVDLVFLGIIPGNPALAAIPLGCFAASLLLQRLAPAT